MGKLLLTAERSAPRGAADGHERHAPARAGADGRTVLLVGGAGYIGSVLTRHLLDRGWGVRSFDLLLFNNAIAVLPFLAHPAYQFVRGDLADGAALEAALLGVDDVVLLAGLVGDPITRKYPDAARRINDVGHAAMLERLEGRGLGRVVFVSTCSNYGFIAGEHLASEEHALKPLSPYAVSKVAAEETILARRGRIDFTPTILRFATAFGLSPRMRFDLTVNEFARELAMGRELVVYDADTWRPYCHVEDFAEVIGRVLEAPAEAVAFEVFNAGGEANNATKRMIVDAVRAEVPGARVRFEERGVDARNYRVGFAKIRARFGFEPRFTVADGVREILVAARHGLFADIDQPKSFYGNHEIVY